MGHVSPDRNIFKIFIIKDIKLVNLFNLGTNILPVHLFPNFKFQMPHLFGGVDCCREDGDQLGDLLVLRDLLEVVFGGCEVRMPVLSSRQLAARTLTRSQ